MKSVMQSVVRSLSFAIWILRRRTGQMIPVGIAFLLLIGSLQIIGMLHDVSSSLTQQQIARSWRGSYDLFVRPQSAVSQVERSRGWVDPQNLLESYGGISDTQLSAIRSLPHISQIMPFATVGWQGMDIIIPITLSHIGLYRITTHWNGQHFSTVTTYYLDVTDLPHLLAEPPISNPMLQHLLMTSASSPVVFDMPIPALQALVGIPATQQDTFRAALLQNALPSSPVHLSISLEQLNAPLSSLPTCLTSVACWQPQSVQSQPIRIQTDGVQLLRYTQTRYSATSVQSASGQVVVTSLGTDQQGSLYRTLLPQHLALPATYDSLLSQPSVATTSSLLPLTAPEHLPLVPTAVHFIPLAQACAVNGPDCYSGLYIRMNGVDHYGQQSLALLQATAAAITARTGLYVDILDGSSTRTVSIISSDNNTNAFLPSTWHVVGVAVQIVHGVDTLQETLLTLCSCICLLAIGASAVLIAIGRKKDVLLLHQTGWSRPLITLSLFLDALFLCLPGFILAALWILYATIFLHGTLPPIAMWLLLIIGAVLYCLTLTIIASAGVGTRRSASSTLTSRKNIGYTARSKTIPILVPLRAMYHSKAFHTKITAPFVCAIVVVCAVFLIALEYLLITNFNQVLVVTILGKQVREALEGPQLALLLVVVTAALLTVGLCTSLLLRGRRSEFSLLAMVGWERKFVLLRILWAGWWPALLSGEVGVLLALVAIVITSTVPVWWTIIALMLCGPFVGLVLVSLVTIGMAWQETERVFTWKT